jgi:tetratricopeptide (TPR) repeat protein
VFRQPLVEEGLYATTDPDARRAIHAGALATLPSDAAPERIALHAEAVGASNVAAAAFAELGTRAEREHKPLDAEQAWTGAVRNLFHRDATLAHAKLSLGRVRGRLQRWGEALAVLEESIQIADEARDPKVAVEAMLQRALILDFSEHYEQSRDVTHAALARAARSVLPEEVAVELALASARLLFRDQKYDAAVVALASVLERAKRVHRESAAASAALLLGCGLSELAKLAESEQVFANLIADCEALNDQINLALAYGNRAWLWSARGEVDQTANDLRLAGQLAREVGAAYVERAATHNLAEQLLWIGDLDEAIQLARRSLALQQRAEGNTSADTLLLARVLAARGEIVEMTEHLNKLTTARAGDNASAGEAALDVLRAIAVHGSAEMWDAALTDSEEIFVHQRLELWQLAHRHGHLSEERRAAAESLAQGDPVWVRRVHEFARNDG